MNYEPNILVLTSLDKCKGKFNRRAFKRCVELGITPYDRFCGCLLKLTSCLKTANPKLGLVVRCIVGEQVDGGVFKKDASDLISFVDIEVKEAYCNCIMDICVSLELLERAGELLELGLKQVISSMVSEFEESLPRRSSYCRARRMNDLSEALENGKELSRNLESTLDMRKYRYSDKGLAGVFES